MIRQTPQTARPSPTTLVGLLALLVAFVLPLAFAPGAEAFIYWTNQTDGTIGRADLDGTGVDERFIGGLYGAGSGYSPGSVALDARHIYWTARTEEEHPRSPGRGSTVRRSTRHSSPPSEPSSN